MTTDWLFYSKLGMLYLKFILGINVSPFLQGRFYYCLNFPALRSKPEEYDLFL